MPIYEFYCTDCHVIFSFLARTASTRRRPECPVCGRSRLERRPSSFAFLKRGTDDQEPDPFEGLDESALEGAMEAMAGEMERLDDNEDPKAMSRALRKFGEISGLELGERMEDALQRMEAGEDLDSIESSLDDDDESLDDLFRIKGSVLRRSRRPRVDDTLYFLD